ncbi:Lipoxygenase homology domain-containing protein 1 [Schistosoma japonicum]|nr:Lipoxygenase homology domain-containing protein 1 [Schistosoma japonicum]
MFMCNHWFSLYKEDGLIARELFGIRSAKTEYSIVTVTGDQEGSGTNSKVYITIYGRTGITPRIELSQENKSTGKEIICAPFARGTSTKFIVKAPNVGAITNIRIKQDESGTEPHWFLERVVVTDMSYPQWTYYFNCGCWLSSIYGDGKLCRLLRGYREPTGTGIETEYKLTFYTSDKMDSGTTAEVYVKLYGERDSSREIWLNSIQQTSKEQVKHYHFTRGSTVEVYLPLCPQLGEISKLKVGHNKAGSSPSWFLNKVIVDDLKMNRVFEFPCYSWIIEPSEMILVCNKSIKKEEKQVIWQKIPLEIRLYTGDLPNAGTTAKVYLRFSGPEEIVTSKPRSDFQKSEAKPDSKGQKDISESKDDVYTTPCVWLEDGTYERNGVALFSIDLPAPKFISPLSQLVVGHDNSGHSPSWFLDKVQVYCPSNGIEQTFPCRKWLVSSKPNLKAEQTLFEEKSLRKQTDKKIPWEVSVKTSPITNSYVTAAVSIIIFGSHDKTMKIQLDRSNLERSSEWTKLSKNELVEMFKPNVESKFRLYIKDIGIPYKLRVEHDNKGSNPHWHLQQIQLTNLNTKEQYEFYCNRWLSTREDDGSILREIPAKGPGITNPQLLYHYIIQIYTGNKPNSGTNANIFINIFGEKGDSGVRWLRRSVNQNAKLFEQNQMDEFVIEAVALGPITKILIGHEERSPGYGWYLAKIILTIKENPKYKLTFECYRWFDVSEDDGQIVRELSAHSTLSVIAYNVGVLTGSCRNAGTIANVFVRLYGLQGESRDIQLKHKETDVTKFEAGKYEEFILACGKLGEIKKIKIWHDGISPDTGWFLDEVTVIDYYLGRRHVFRVNRWLAKNEADGLLSLELQPTSINNIERMMPYEIIIFTGDKKGSQIKCCVTVQLFGTPLKRKTEIIQLSKTKHNFKFGQPEVFRIFAPDIGPLQKLIIERDGTGVCDRWFLEKVLVRRPSNFFQIMDRSPTTTPARSLTGQPSKDRTIPEKDANQLNTLRNDINASSPSPRITIPEEIKDAEGAENYWFFFNTWLSKQHDNKQMNCETFSCTESGKPLHTLMESYYEVIVKTGDRKYAGTDSHVYLTMFGIDSESKEYHLTASKTHQNKFEQNHEDIFDLNAIGLGSLTKIRIRHNNTGIESRWFLDYILIRETIQQKKMEYLFPCYHWLSATTFDGLIMRELSVASPNILERWKSGHDIVDDSRLILEDQSTIYHIRIHSGSQSNISSDAHVQVQLYGDKDFTGNIRLYKAWNEKGDALVNKFQANQVSDFIVKAINIGNIKKIKIDLDVGGGSIKWFIEHIEVEAKKLGLLWKFECNQWITSQHPELVLYTDPKGVSFVKPMITYQIKTFTSDISGADTTSSVYIQLYGNDGLSSSIRHLHDDGEHRFQRNKIDTFYVELEELQEPFSKLRIWHNDKGSATDWHLNKVEIRKIKTRQNVFVTYIFPCNKWLSCHMDQAALERELIPSHIIQDQNGKIQLEKQITPKWLMNTYEVKIITGNRTFAGTDASVYLTLYGDNGDSGERKLTKSLTHRNKFERGQTDVFQMEIVDLGKINKVRIRHDNTGVNPSWYLSKIEVFNITKSQSSNAVKDHPSDTRHLVNYIFNCEAWLSTEHDDGVLDRFFSAESIKGCDVLDYSPAVIPKDSTPIQFKENKLLETIPYLVTVITGSDKKAGTPGPVWIYCVGNNKENSEKFILSDCYNRTALKRGTTKHFRLFGPKINYMTEIQVGNDAPESPSMGWLLQSLYVSLPTLGKLYLVDFKGWLSANRGDKKRVCNIKLLDRNLLTFKEKITYHLKISTASDDKAGTDCCVNIQLFGTDGVTNSYILEKISNRFSKGITDNISLEMENVGKLLKLRIGHDNQGKNKHWKLNYVEITVASTNQLYRFVYDDWLSLTYGKRKSLFVDLPARINDTVQLKETCLDIFIKTGNLPFSSTDANVYIQLYGEYGDSGEILLKQTVSNQKPFQNNSIDNFKISPILKLGNLARCRIWHDNKGSSPNWYCEWIEVKEIIVPGKRTMACYWKFACNKWLSLSDDNKQLMRDIPCSEVYISDSKGQRINDQESIETMLLIENTMSLSDSKDNSEGKLVYEIVIQTGKMKDSGTTCDAWIIVEGKRGRGPKLELINQFENPILQINQTNTFQLSSFPLGDIETIRLGIQERNDNRQANQPENQSQKWFCEKISIRDPASKRTYIFLINQWLSVIPNSSMKKDILVSCSKMIEDPCKQAFNELKNKQTVMYKVSIYTGTKGCANTDANIFITMFSTKPGLNSGRIALKRENRSPFDRRQLDEFLVESIDLEFIERIIIEHDNTGVSPDWYLDKVLITNQTNNQVHIFQCNQWISKKKGDCKLWKQLLISK